MTTQASEGTPGFTCRKGKNDTIAHRDEPLDVRVREPSVRVDGKLFTDAVYAQLETRLSEPNELSSIEEAILSIMHDERLNGLIRRYAAKSGIHELEPASYGRGTYPGTEMPLVLYETGKRKRYGHGVVYIGPDEHSPTMPVFVEFSKEEWWDGSPHCSRYRLKVAEKEGRLVLEWPEKIATPSPYCGKSIAVVDNLTKATGEDIYRGLERVLRTLLAETGRGDTR